MKIKLNIYITRPEQFARNPESNCYTAITDRHMDDTWTFVHEVEIDLSEVNNDDILAEATDDLDADIGKHTAAINILKNRKAELLALPNLS